MSYILLQSAGGIQQFLPLLLVLVVMYFFFFRPQMKKQKEERKFQDSLQKGMRVVTNSGIHGKILDLNDDKTVNLESENTRLKINNTALSKEQSAVYLPKDEKGGKNKPAKSEGKDSQEGEKK